MRAKSAIRTQVRLENDETLLQRNGPAQVEKKGLSALLPTGDESDRGMPLRRAAQVRSNGLHFLRATHLQGTQSHRRHTAGSQRLHDRVPMQPIDGRWRLGLVRGV